jgi:DNA-directed RNA polymerase subunit RPC12/RpoP
MSELRTFFRFCPQCGRRFHIKLVSKNLVHLEREQAETGRATLLGPRSFSSPLPPIIVQEGDPVMIDIEEFQNAYRCGHCGHEWTEKHVEEVKEK